MNDLQLSQTIKQLKDAIEVSNRALGQEASPKLNAYLEGTIKGLQFALVLLENYLE